MPLQIRRGSSVQRLAITPLDGELIWDQTEKRLYVGDGEEVGGTIATGYNNEDAILAIGEALDAGTHSGITFTNDSTSISATLSNVDAEVLSGTANISILSNDGSTLLLNSATGAIQGTSAVFNTIEGNLTGSVFASDSSVIVDSESYTVTAGSGFFTELYVPEININASKISGIASLEGIPAIELGTPTEPNKAVIYNSDVLGSLYLEGLENNNSIYFKARKGSIIDPEVVESGQTVGSLDFFAFTGHTAGGGLLENYAKVGSLRFETDDTAPLNPEDPWATGVLVMTVGDDNAGGSFSILGLEKKAIRTNVPFIAAYFTNAERALISPEDGMIIYNLDDNKFQGYQNGSWINLDGS